MSHKSHFEKFAKAKGFKRFIQEDDGIDAMLDKIAKAVSYMLTEHYYWFAFPLLICVI